ncbi:unnamed protein product [Acanthocheilonema viteae]|uniref:Uncharacterized protein n=1 Tax=Acanthocheilonema viteae TaxID=6277 RepID=A0A498S633_ACAVI|nr:unnamed protein product [Acanthocheilonema viteae]
MLTTQLSLFVVFTVIVWTTANKENSPIARSKKYEHIFSLGSKISPEIALSNNILLCCLQQIRRNLGRVIQQTTISCKTTCDVIRPAGALYVRDVPDSGPLLPIRSKLQFDGYGNLAGNARNGDINGKLRSFKLQIPFPAIGSRFTTSWGTIKEIPIPREFRQYTKISGNLLHKTTYSAHKPPAFISSNYTSTYLHSEERNTGSTSYRRLSHMEIPSISSTDTYMTEGRRKLIASYIRPMDMTMEDKQSHTLDTTQINYLNPDPQTQVAASEMVHEISNGQRLPLSNNVKNEALKAFNKLFS